MPEEINRIVADEFSDYLFIHSDEASDNLLREGIAAERIHFVGNTMIDTLVAMEERFRALDAAERLGLDRGEYLLVTLHRPALVDGPLLFDVPRRAERGSPRAAGRVSACIRGPARCSSTDPRRPGAAPARAGGLPRLPVAAGRRRAAC